MKEAFGLSVPEGWRDVCDPSRCALIVYDMQNGIVPQIAEGQAVLKRCEQLLSAARTAGFRIFFTRHLFLPNRTAGVGQLRRAMVWQRQTDPAKTRPFITQGSTAWQIVPELAPREDEVVIDKITMSAFEGTFLNIALRDTQIEAFLIAGIALEVGIEPTVRQGLDLNYLPIVVTDACGSKTAEVKERSLATLTDTGEVMTCTTAELVAAMQHKPLPFTYLWGVDSASTQPVELGSPVETPPAALKVDISAALLDTLWREAEAGSLDLSRDEFAQKLMSVGAKYNYGLSPAQPASSTQVETFYRALQLRELALAHACVLGRDAAWEQFLQRFRAPLTQAAVGITGSPSLGQDLADSLYSELFGLTERDGQRRSPLASYSGRGSLMGWLRTTLAQRHVDHHRRTRRETPLEDTDFAAAPSPPTPTTEALSQLSQSLSETLRGLPPDDRFLLTAYFIDQRTLLEISQLLYIHESTVSRKLKRLTSGLHQQLLKRLQASGMSKRAADEALGTDPRDLDLNLRTLLQTPTTGTFSNQTDISGTKQT